MIKGTEPAKIELLEAQIRAAEAALESSEIAELYRVRAALLDAIQLDWLTSSAHDPHIATPVARAKELRQILRTMIERLEHAELTRSLVACPCCGGVELLVVKQCSAQGILDRGVPLVYSLIACKGCGDMRMRCEELGKLPRSERCSSITLPELARGPFR